MLLELRVRDYAVIDDLRLEVAPGLNVLSGETGAGKSIIVGALSLLLGERASDDVVRAGADHALVEAVFDVRGREPIVARLGELGIPVEDGLLILRREVALEGRNRAWANGSPATVGIVRELGRLLVDLHGQHEHQTLLRSADQRAILDAFAGATELAGVVTALHEGLAGLEREREDREARVRELESRADFIRFQVDEIAGAELVESEDTALEGEVARLEHAEELARTAESIHEDLYAGEGAVADRIRSLQNMLDRIAQIDGSLSDVAELLEEAYQATSEAGQRLGSYAAAVEGDPALLEQVRSRLDLLFRLKRKYGPKLDDVISTGRRLAAEIDEVDSGSMDLDSLQRRIEQERAGLARAAGALSDARATAGDRLGRRASEVFPSLGLEQALLRVSLEALPEIGAGGAERVEFRAALNSGFEPRSLSRVASGGELSRVMLTLKSILASVDRIPTLIFDEIDAGVGGEVATAVASKLEEVAREHQVFVITHLAQLASRADHHLLVEKTASVGGELASARVTALSGEARVREIARMLGGDPESSASRDHARELLQPTA